MLMEKKQSGLKIDLNSYKLNNYIRSTVSAASPVSGNDSSAGSLRLRVRTGQSSQLNGGGHRARDRRN